MYDVTPIIACCQALAARCDGAQEEDAQGYNGSDTTFGKRCSRIPVELWDAQLAYAAHRMLRKYKGQLAAYGHDFDAIQVPAKPIEADEAQGRAAARQADRQVRTAAAPRIAPTATIQGEAVVFNLGVGNWDIFKPMLAAIKALADRRFDGVTKNWTSPITAATAEPILDIIRAYPFVVADDFEEVLVAGLTAKVASEAKATAASRASTSDFTVAGLGGTLRPFQRAGVEYAVGAKRCLIADDMGLGKTVQALAVFQHENAFPALVICPASVKINWQREAQKWLPGKVVAVLNGKDVTVDDLSRVDVVVANYDILRKHEAVLMDMPWQAVAFDEFHYAKNPKAQRSQICEAIVKDVPIRLGLTGTPVLNRPAELINLLAILDRLDAAGGPGKLIYHYAGGYRDGYGVRYPTNPDPVRLEELNARLRTTCLVRRTKDQVLTELPAKQRADVWLTIDNRAAYDRAERGAVKGLGDAAEHLTRIGTLRQLAAEGKLEAIKAWVTDFLESGEKLVIFAQHIATQQALIAAFPGCAAVLGEMDAQTRQDNVDAFQRDPTVKLIVCSLKAAREGITLTAASNVAFAELGWHPGEMLQAEDRCHRIGQTNAVTAWYLLAAGTIDEDMNELIQAKAVAVTALANGNRMTEEEALALKAGTAATVAARLQKKYAK